jgi:hypothetical protein
MRILHVENIYIRILLFGNDKTKLHLEP